jgi:hypothetical protein
VNEWSDEYDRTQSNGVVGPLLTVQYSQHVRPQHDTRAHTHTNNRRQHEWLWGNFSLVAARQHAHRCRQLHDDTAAGSDDRNTPTDDTARDSGRRQI